MDKNETVKVPYIPDRVAAFGALTLLLAQSVKGGEYSAEVLPDRTTVYHLALPVWAELSDVSRRSLAKLLELADEVHSSRDSLFSRYAFHVRLR